MAWQDISTLFRDTVAGDLPEPSINDVVSVVAGLDGKSMAREITAAFIAPRMR